MLEIDDLSFLDMDELGVRPDALANDEIAHGMDFDSTPIDLFGQKKFVEFPSGKVDLSQMNSSTLEEEEEEEFEYDIDPETGEKIFREAILGSSHSLSSSSSSTPSDYCWVEEYLSNLPTVPVDIPKRSVIDHPTSSHSDFDWQRNNSALFYPMEEKSSLFHSSSETFYLPLNNENQSSYHLYGVSTDDEHSISNGSQGRRFYSSTETTLFERNLHHNGQFLPAKLEKIEHDEHAISPLFVRRSSTRSNSQGQQDEDLLRRANIPLTVHDITQSSTEEYNRHLARLNHLTPEQMHIIKDIRRRGKNKIAAQNCRKRKANSVEVLLEEVDELKRMKNDLEERKQIYQQQIDETRREYEYLHHQVHPNRPIPPTIFVK